MNLPFDLFDFFSNIIPGAAILIVGVFFLPKVRSFFWVDRIDPGGLGLFLIVAFLIGLFVQGFTAEVIRVAWWGPQGGLPTEQMAKADSKLLSRSQRDRFKDAVKKRFNVEADAIGSDETWTITAEIYSLLRSEKKTERIDIFSRNYLMYRGLAGSCFILAVCVLLFARAKAKHFKFPLAALFALVVVVALVRMQEFGTRFAQELAVEFIRLPPSKT